MNDQIPSGSLFDAMFRKEKKEISTKPTKDSEQTKEIKRQETEVLKQKLKEKLHETEPRSPKKTLSS